MTDTRPTLEELNAYVDRELAAADAARVARAVAENAALAEQVAMLSRLKAVAGSEDFNMPEIKLPRKPRAGLRLSMAAAIATLLLAGVVAVLMGEWCGGETDWLDTAQLAHSEWAERASPGAPPSAGTLLPAFAQFGAGTQLPDLSDAKLSMAHVQAVPVGSGGDRALHVGYVGTRGCRVSLWMVRTPIDVSDVLILNRRAERTSYTWRAGDLTYAMFASGMAAPRFRLIAEAAYKSTRARAQPDSDMRTALRRSRENSPPCAG